MPPSDTVLSRNTRSFIVLVALLQGGLLYLAQKGQSLGWWPFSELSGSIYWYTLVLSVPSAMLLSVQRLDDAQFWRHSAGLAALFGALASWSVWNASGAPHIDSSKVLTPFGLSLALALFVGLPWLQCRLIQGRWHAPYEQLYELAWQNGLTLAVTAVFTGICWLLLLLWGSLFRLIDVRFFHDLFQETAFVYLATGAMVGLGILIGRTQQRAIHMARQIVLGIFKGLLPLLSFIALLFVISLPFTGLQPLWNTRWAASILINVQVLLVFFVNAVYQDGQGLRVASRTIA